MLISSFARHRGILLVTPFCRSEFCLVVCRVAEQINSGNCGAPIPSPIFFSLAFPFIRSKTDNTWTLACLSWKANPSARHNSTHWLSELSFKEFRFPSDVAKSEGIPNLQFRERWWRHSKLGDVTYLKIFVAIFDCLAVPPIVAIQISVSRRYDEVGSSSINTFVFGKVTCTSKVLFWLQGIAPMSPK